MRDRKGRALIRCTFCAAVTIPFSGIHSSGVRISPSNISIDLKSLLLPVQLHSFITKYCTALLWHKSASDAVASTSGSGRCARTWRRFTSCRMMIAMGCLASAEASTQIMATRLHDLCVASRRSSAMYYPRSSLEPIHSWIPHGVPRHPVASLNS